MKYPISLGHELTLDSVIGTAEVNHEHKRAKEVLNNLSEYSFVPTYEEHEDGCTKLVSLSVVRK